MSDVAYLIQSDDTKREIYVDVQSVSQKEDMSAGLLGFKAEFKLVTSFCDYNFERKIEFGCKKYVIYRTFVSGNHIELYLTEKLGVR